jgi:hypothetical protein
VCNFRPDGRSDEETEYNFNLGTNDETYKRCSARHSAHSVTFDQHLP